MKKCWVTQLCYFSFVLRAHEKIYFQELTFNFLTEILASVLQTEKCLLEVSHLKMENVD